MKKTWLVIGVALTGLVLVRAASAGLDFGLKVERMLVEQSNSQFGVPGALHASSADQVTEEQALADPTSLVTLAKGLRVGVVTSGVAAPDLDMITLWPDDVHPVWLIVCNEADVEDPALQRVNLATGEVATILTGTDSCDPAHRTPWGTVLFAEEAGGGPEGGRVYELSDPVGTTGVTLDRTTGTFSGGVGAENFAVRPALGRLSYEGFAIYENGVVYYGDELRPDEGTPGGAYYKFVPTEPLGVQPAGITDLDDSPLVAGSIYGLRLGLRSGATDYGQGTQYGFGTWVPMCSEEACEDIDLGAEAAALSLTGYYRPEDIDIDRGAEAEGRVAFCANNTGNEDADQLYGETVCITDGTLEEATENIATPEVQLLVAGSPTFAMPDNITYQPGRGNWIVHEDGATDYLAPHNDDLWDCLPDGPDENLLSDGCVRIGTLNDLTAEWTGGVFKADGKHFYVSIQHNVSGFGVILDITGWN